MGDAVTGINRADSASEKSNGPMLRQHHADCNISHCCDRFMLPNGQVGQCRHAVRTAHQVADVAVGVVSAFEEGAVGFDERLELCQRGGSFFGNNSRSTWSGQAFSVRSNSPDSR